MKIFKRPSKRRLISIFLLFLVLVGISAFVYVKFAFGATRTWDGGGTEVTCPGNANGWSCAQNWSSDTAPGASDIAQFDNTSDKDATIDASFGGSVAGVAINAGYDGTITQARSLAVGSSDFAQASGVWSGGSQTFDINGDFTVSGGTHNATTGTWTVELNATFSGGSAVLTGATLTLDDSALAQPSILTCARTIPTVIVTKDAQVNNSFTLSANCIITSITHTMLGSATINGTISGGTMEFTDTASGQTTTLSCSGTLGATVTVTKDSHTNNTFTLSSGCNATFNDMVGIGSVTIDGTMNIGSITTERDVTIGGTLNMSGAINLIDSASAQDSTLTCASTVPSVIVTKDAAVANTFTLSSNCTVTSITGSLRGNATINGTLRGGTLQFNDSASGDDSTLTCNGRIDLSVEVVKDNSSTSDFTNAGSCTVKFADVTSVGSFTNTGRMTIGNLAAILNFTNTGFANITGALSFVDTTSTQDSVLTCTGTIPIVVVTKDSHIGNDFTLSSGCQIKNITLTMLGSATINGKIWGGTMDFVDDSSVQDSTLTCSGTIDALVTVTKDAAAGNDFTLSSGCTLARISASIRGAATISGNITSGTITFIDSGGNEDTTLTCDTANVIGADIVVVKDNAATSELIMGSSCIVSGNFTRTDGVVTNPGSAYTLDLRGNFSMSTTDAFGGANLTLQFSGTNDQTITQNNSGTVSTPVIINKPNGKSVTLATNFTIDSTGQNLTLTAGTLRNSTLNLTVNSTFTINGSFVQGTGNVTAGTYTLGTTGSWNNRSTGDIVIGAGGLSNSGLIAFDGTAQGCGEADNISITSSSNGVQRSWTGSGNFTMYDVSIQDQGGTAYVPVYSGTSVSGNGNNFVFTSSCPTPEESSSTIRRGVTLQGGTTIQ